MKILFVIVTVVTLAGVGVAFTPSAQDYWKRYVTPEFQTTPLSRGDITSFVRATGTVRPVLAVEVGSFVSGPIEALHADFNDQVTKGQLIAEIDPRIYQGEVARDEALLATQRAEVLRVTAMLQQAINEEERGLAVRKDNPAFVSDKELDELKFARISLEAQLAVAEANVQQAQAQLNNSQANLGYTEIRSPVDGVIIDRRVEPGQTVAASFTTPVLYVVAPDLAGEMHIFATVDEADIGLVKSAQEQQLPVYFTVDAYPDQRFEGTIKQIRSRSAVVESVVTFPVVVSTTNPDRKLIPGMTANLFFETGTRQAVLRVPNAAIHFYPAAQHVREQDRALLSPDHFATSLPDNADEKLAWMSGAADRRHLWVVEGTELRAVEVTIGVSDDFFTEIASGDLQEGDQVAVAVGSGAGS